MARIDARQLWKRNTVWKIGKGGNSIIWANSKSKPFGWETFCFLSLVDTSHDHVILVDMLIYTGFVDQIVFDQKTFNHATRPAMVFVSNSYGIFKWVFFCSDLKITNRDKNWASTDLFKTIKLASQQEDLLVNSLTSTQVQLNWVGVSTWDNLKLKVCSTLTNFIELFQKMDRRLLHSAS
jgi:hypothetical protein